MSPWYSYGYLRSGKELYGDPLLLTHPKATSPKQLYAAIAKLLSPDTAPGEEPAVQPAHFKLYVAKNIYGTDMDANSVDGDDDRPIETGMKAKITVRATPRRIDRKVCRPRSRCLTSLVARVL